MDDFYRFVVIIQKFVSNTNVKSKNAPHFCKIYFFKFFIKTDIKLASNLKQTKLFKCVVYNKRLHFYSIKISSGIQKSK